MPSRTGNAEPVGRADQFAQRLARRARSALAALAQRAHQHVDQSMVSVMGSAAASALSVGADRVVEAEV